MIRSVFIIAGLFGVLSLSSTASAHCDTTRGPVVTAARTAIEAGDSSLVLHWVRPADEAAVRTVFDHTMKVRTLGPHAKDLADRYFFETLVRIHRAGEGAAYSGLVDGEPEPIIAATDRALEQGSVEELERHLSAEVRSGLAERFAAARAAKDFRAGDVDAGRRFVAAYVPLTHWVENVSLAAKGASEHGGAAERHGSHAYQHRSDAHQLLPWAVAGLLGIVATVEGVFLLRRRRRDRA